MESNSNMFNIDKFDGIPELPRHRRGRARDDRHLNSNDNNAQSYLVDEDGNEYDPYSLAWRYIGLYIDCEIDDSTEYYYNKEDVGNVYRGRRKLPEDDDEGGNCERKLLWAAYVDTRYQGNNIEEYNFFDISTLEWDDTACKASGERHRCAKMNCHEPHSHFKLVGVFKETDGMYDWTEQLFKHEGMCVWNDEDVYDEMEEWMETWPAECKQLSMPDYYGNTIYLAVHPLPEGNMTLGVYTDEKCTSLSTTTDLTTYIMNLYQSSYYYYYGGAERGQAVAEMYTQAIATWNEYMSAFKVCQPCKAYNLWADEEAIRDDRARNRLLNSGDEDGDGYETERFNCYDDAGYTNVDQCYKFMSKTDLEPAEDVDLILASEQGSILKIKSNGQWYGKGGYSAPMTDIEKGVYISLAVIGVIGITTLIKYRGQLGLKLKNKTKVTPSLQEALNDDGDAEKHIETKSFDATVESSASSEIELPTKSSSGDNTDESSASRYTPPASLESVSHEKFAMEFSVSPRMHAKLEEYLPEVETSLPVLENIESDVVGQARQGNPGHIGTVDLTDRVDVVLGTDTLCRYNDIQRRLRKVMVIFWMT